MSESKYLNNTISKTNKKQESSSLTSVSSENSCLSYSVCSSTDCTGLIPALPSSEAELEAYEEMYQFCCNSQP